MKTIYHLQSDSKAIAGMQRASLDAGPVGLRITHGLVGSNDWWSQIKSGVLTLHSVKGEISGFWPGQWGDGPAEFELQTEDGQHSIWLCKIPPTEAKKEFCIGRNVVVEFVVQELKSSLEGIGNETNVTVSISVA